MRSMHMTGKWDKRRFGGAVGMAVAMALSLSIVLPKDALACTQV